MSFIDSRARRICIWPSLKDIMDYKQKLVIGNIYDRRFWEYFLKMHSKIFLMKNFFFFKLFTWI